MFRSKDRAPLASLVVHANDIATEVYVIGDTHDVRASGVGLLRAELPAGACRVKFCAAEGMATLMTDLRPGALTLIEGPSVPFRSAVPFADERRSALRQWEAAEHLLDEVPLMWGEGARIAVFLRREAGGGGVPADICHVMREDGQASVMQTKSASNAETGTRGLPLAVSPGLYRVQFAEGADRRAELCVPAIAGWTTMVFGVIHEAKDGGAYVRMDEVAVHYWRLGEPFALARRALRVAELSRAALVGGRIRVAESVLQSGAEVATKAPMGLVYAAATVLQRPSRARVALVRSALAALADVSFSTPDTVVLHARLMSEGETVRPPKVSVDDLLLAVNRNWMLRNFGGRRSGQTRRGCYTVRVEPIVAALPSNALEVESVNVETVHKTGSFASAFRHLYALLQRNRGIAPKQTDVPASPLEAYVFAAAAAPVGFFEGQAEDNATLTRRARQVAAAIPVPAWRLAAAAERLVERLS